jgi:type I restriction enzyme S subunit
VNTCCQRFREFLRPNRRPYRLGPDEDADLVGMRRYGYGPFRREKKAATRIRKKSHFLIRSGAVIDNKLFAWKGAFGIVPPELDGMFVSDKFPTYELDERLCLRDYLRWYFPVPRLWEQARGMSVGAAAMSKLTLNPPRFLDLSAPLPPLPEQRRIVTKLDQLAARIREAREARADSEREGKALLASAIGRTTHELAVTGVLADVLRGKPRNGWSARCDNASDGTGT